MVTALNSLYWSVLSLAVENLLFLEKGEGAPRWTGGINKLNLLHHASPAGFTFPLTHVKGPSFPTWQTVPFAPAASFPHTQLRHKHKHPFPKTALSVLIMALVILAASNYELSVFDSFAMLVSLMETLACPGTFFIPHTQRDRGTYFCFYAISPKAGSFLATMDWCFSPQGTFSNGGVLVVATGMGTLLASKG